MLLATLENWVIDPFPYHMGEFQRSRSQILRLLVFQPKVGYRVTVRPQPLRGDGRSPVSSTGLQAPPGISVD